MGSNQNIEKVVQLLKGESSFWINKNKICPEKFEWQTEYFALSISESIKQNVINYILNQEKHHKNSTFEDEYNEFISKYNFKN